MKKCQKCRYDACIAAGMSNHAVKTGRHSIQRKITTNFVMKQMAQSNSLLPEPTQPRKRRRTSQQSKGRNSSSDQARTQQENARAKAKPASFSQIRSSNSEVARSSSNHNPFLWINFIDFCSFQIPWNDNLSHFFLLNGQAYSNQTAIETSLNCLRYIRRISEYSCIPLHALMNAEQIWNVFLSFALEKQLHCVLSFVKNLAGFTELNVADRIQLFSYAFFPILLAQMATDYDEGNPSNINCLSLRDENSISIMRHYYFGETIDTVRSFLQDAGRCLATLSPSDSEFSTLCAIIFFNPNVPNLTDQQQVQFHRNSYRFADEHYHQKRFILQNSMFFTQFSAYFQQMTPLFAQMLVKIDNCFPQILRRHGQLNDIFQALSANTS